jgi:alpha-galactosidase
MDLIADHLVPWSFTIDGKPSVDWLAAATRSSRTSGETTVTTWTDAATGLRLKYEQTQFRGFPAIEWVLWFENTGTAPTPIVENVQALDLVFSSALPGDAAYVVNQTSGAPSNPSDFTPVRTPLRPGGAVEMGGGGGRSSNKDFPFFRIDFGDGSMIVAVGWSGQWKARLACDEADGAKRLRVTAGLELTHFRLLPGEKVRSPRMLILSHPGDPAAAHNLFRRLIRDRYAVRSGGTPAAPILFCNTCFTRGGGWLNECDEANQISLIKALAPLAVQAVITDAGWFKGGWPEGAGNWDADPAKYPRGMGPVAAAAKACGMTYGLWFEPERVVKGTDLDLHHADWVLGQGGGLLNFGLPEVQRHFFGIVEQYLKLPGFAVYRQDFNMDPLGNWRAADAPDRQGITEMKYIEGLYAYWDSLRAAHPDLLMEECASGGRRIDLETIRRFQIHQKSDHWFDNLTDQASLYALSAYLPNGLISVPLDRLDDYSFHSAMASSLIPGWIADDPKFDTARAKAITGTYRRVRHLLSGDWYGLTDGNRDEAKWLASQYDRPDLGEGMVLVFRRAKCTEDALTVALKGLDEKATYAVTFTTTGETRRMPGRELAAGLVVTLKQAPKSELITYRKAS